MAKKQKYEELEEEYAKYIGTDYAVSCNTGTAALHLALKALGVGEGDEVIIPEFTMIACAFAVSYCGAIPVFVDCGDDLLIDVKKIKQRLTTRTKVIMPVHIYGRVCDMDAIMAIAKEYKLRVLEDCCESQGALYKGKMTGTFDVGAFSFYQNKIIPAEEGGMVTTNDPAVASRVAFLKNMAFNRDHDYLHTEIGFNYRMTNAQARYALENLQQVNTLQQMRIQVQNWYDKHLKKEFQMPKREVVWVYDIRHPQKDKVVSVLNEKGIAARHSFKPMSIQPIYKRYSKNLKALKMSQEVCYLPVNPLMTEEMVINICRIIDSVS